VRALYLVLPDDRQHPRGSQDRPDDGPGAITAADTTFATISTASTRPRIANGSTNGVFEFDQAPVPPSVAPVADTDGELDPVFSLTGVIPLPGARTGVIPAGGVD
jgi:hypothetical protein